MATDDTKINSESDDQALGSSLEAKTDQQTLNSPETIPKPRHRILDSLPLLNIVRPSMLLMP